ncbi:protein YgfX [Alishewanella jeotgali]|uniref:protein YgfX n=1 Tax=Alishewanella jeotgali TaxID=545533 RepID=UPI0002D4DCF1|nr:protein YgfX [Alishewanella jeotgali]
MSGYSLALNTSLLRRRLLLAAGAALALLYLLLPLQGSSYLLAWLSLTAWFYLLWSSKAASASALLLDAEGGLRWLDSTLSAGSWRPGSVISRYATLLCWTDTQGRRQQQWLFADQFSAADYRSLARWLYTQRWRHNPDPVKN